MRGLNTKLHSLFNTSMVCEHDLLCFTETWLKPSVFNSEILATSYNIIRRDRNGTDRGGGVLIAIKSSYYSEEIIISSPSDIEICCALFTISNKKFYIICSYIPPSSPYQIYEAHFDSFKYISTLLSPDDHLIIMGDFNLPSVTWTYDPDEPYRLLPHCGNPQLTEFLNNVTSLCAFQINKIRNSLGKLLDLVFVDDISIFQLQRIVPLVYPEDIYHPTLLIELENMHNSNQAVLDKGSKLFNFKKCNLSALYNLLVNTNWDAIIPDAINSEVELDYVVLNFNSLLFNYFEMTVPKEFSKRENSPKWFNNKLRRLRNAKAKKYKKYKRTKFSTDFVNYVNARRQYQNFCKLEYEKYLSDLSMNLRCNPRSFWDFVKAKRKSRNNLSRMAFHDKISESDLETSEFFATFFKSVYSTNTYNSDSYPISINGCDIQSPIITTELVESSANMITPSLKAGPDCIPAFILKTFSATLAEPLSSIFNHSLRLGFFPSVWKSSFIVPLHKSGSKSQIKNYRGIANLSAIPKLFEQIVTKQLFFELEKCISPYQHGFIRNKSTVTNLLEFTTVVFQNFKRSLQTDVIYTDLSKAFDVVNHKLLLIKLSRYGFPRKLLEWINSYLTNRSQNVLYNSVVSSKFAVTSGVPQGSHIGPLLFLIYINDLPSVIDYSNILLYADDVKLFRSDNSVVDYLQNDLDRLASWCELNLLNLNLSKCKHMAFGRKLNYHRLYSIAQTPLETVEQFCDLGVLMDSKLRFNLHISVIVNKANSVLGAVKRWSKDFNDPYVTKSLFTSLVRPILEYASIIWNPCYNCDISKIESVQKQFLLFSLRNLGWPSDGMLPPYKSRLKLINLPSLESRRTMLDVMFVVKLLDGNINSPELLSRLNINVPVRPTRRYSLLKLSHCNKNYCNFEPFNVAFKKFNELYDIIDFNRPYFSLKKDLINRINL